MGPGDVLEHPKWMLPPVLEVLAHLVWDGPITNNDEDTLSLLRSQWSLIWKSASPEMFPTLKKVMVQTYGLSGLGKDREVIWQRVKKAVYRAQNYGTEDQLWRSNANYITHVARGLRSDNTHCFQEP